MSEYDELEAKVEELSLLIIRIEAKTKALELYANLAASKARREALEEAAEAVRSMKVNLPKIERGQAIYAYNDGLTDAEAAIRNMLREQKDA